MNHPTTLHDTGFLRGRSASWFSRLIRTVTDSYNRHVTLSELANLDNHMLDDIGLRRDDLSSFTFKRTFEARQKFDLQDLGRC